MKHAVVVMLWGLSGCPTGAPPAEHVEPSPGRVQQGALPADSSEASAPAEPSNPVESTPPREDGADDEALRRVPRPWPVVPNPSTHDVDADLLSVLEREALEGACEAYRQGDHRRATRLRCGKWMFFYESFGTVGIPTHLLELFQNWFEPYFGPSFSTMGFVPDPYSEPPIPLGLVPSTQRMGTMQTHAFSCASCHFGRMPDGRYAVGYANHQLNYGRFFAAMVALVKLGLNPHDQSVHPTIRHALAPHVQRARRRPRFLAALTGLGLNVATRGGDALSQGFLDLSPAEQLRFWQLRPGTMDFLTKPMADDGVWTVSRVLNLWNLPNDQRIEEAGMPHALLSWTGIGESLMDFLHGFVAISGSTDTWDDAALQPLAEYIYSLRAPQALTVHDREAIERGVALFTKTGCIDCHDGPSGEGRTLYDFETIGTDTAMRAIYNPNEDGQLCCGLDVAGERATLALKSPRLAGQRYRTRLLHNGALDRLTQLLCLEARPVTELEAQSSQGHRFGCEELTPAEKFDLIRYLEHL